MWDEQKTLAKCSIIWGLLGTASAYMVLLSPIALAFTHSTSENDNATNGEITNDNGSRADREIPPRRSYIFCVDCSPPVYPIEALRQAIEGSPKLALELDPQGNVSRARLVQSSGNEALDFAALEAARKWKFGVFGQLRTIFVEIPFTIEGSRRYRESQQREERRSIFIRDRNNE